MTSQPLGQRLWIYDTTLRDGSQREGISLSIADKLSIAQELDRLGVPLIEGGWPGANPKDVQFFWQIQQQPLTQAEVVAFCSTKRPGVKAEDDDFLRAILAAGSRWVTLFGKSWDLHVRESLQVPLAENLAIIDDSIRYLVGQGRQVIYDAEHWFDGYKANPAYALQTLEAAANAGACWLVLCDTNGGTLPSEVSQIVAAVQAHLGAGISLGIHSHNDSETAVANAIAAVEQGARMVQGTINGYGERCGNANLCSLIPNLQLKLGYDCLPPDRLAALTAVSRSVSEVVNLAPDDHAAFVGRSAFAHKGGIHVSAVRRNPLTYEHLPPESVGNQRRIVISEQSGLSNVFAKAQRFGLSLSKTDPVGRELLARLKSLEHQGYQFEAAEASFELLMREVMGLRSPFFSLSEFQVHCSYQGRSQANPPTSPQANSQGNRSTALATVKVLVGDQEMLEAGEGNGPVSALDQALRKALGHFYPEIDQFCLTDYKVRILDGAAGTGATTRVLVESSAGNFSSSLDRSRRWTTLGLSPNILEASYQAVAEGLEYGLMLTRGPELLGKLPYPQCSLILTED
jgi:2-isopropylmalate synthase